nr:MULTISPECIES: hypothetical protein [Burkholderia]
MVAFDETRKQLGLDDLAAASAMLLGQADVPVPGKFAGATPGTSVASVAARKLFPQTLPFRLPMITGVGLSGIRIAFTRRLGAWVGRAVPVVGEVFLGEVFLARDAYLIMRNTVSTYNRIVKPEDRVL